METTKSYCEHCEVVEVEKSSEYCGHCANEIVEYLETELQAA